MFKGFRCHLENNRHGELDARVYDAFWPAESLSTVKIDSPLSPLSIAPSLTF